MPKVHSHYENLKVARDALPEAIRAAYRTLTRKYHPDRNHDDADAARIMSMVNVAYEVLSDPARKREHDLWIAQAEAQPARPVRSKNTLHSPSTSRLEVQFTSEEAAWRRARRSKLRKRVHRVIAHLGRHRISYGFVGVSALCLAAAGVWYSLPPTLSLQVAAAPAPAASKAAAYARSPTAPNGHRWPSSSAYIEGYEQANKGGLSEVTVDNSQNDTDMFAKLVSLDGPTAAPVRIFFVAAHSRFTLAGLTIGTYDLRYRDLHSGSLSRSPAFIIEEVHTTHGPQRGAMTMKLYEAGRDGMQAYALGDAEF